jgi:hypothetical protein
LKAAIPLAIEVAAWPNNANKPIPWKLMVAKDKLLAEGSPSETKVILGRHFNFRTLTISLPDHKFIAWTAAIQKMWLPWNAPSQEISTWPLDEWDMWDFLIPWI